MNKRKGSNTIKDEGIRLIAKCQLPKIEELLVGNFWLIQGKIISQGFGLKCLINSQLQQILVLSLGKIFLTQPKVRLAAKGAQMLIKADFILL